MSTLADYAREHFPNHEISGDHGRDLADHTVVAQVMTRARTQTVAQDARRGVSTLPVEAVVVEPSDPTMLPTEDEDKEGVADLPKRRFAASAVIVGLIFGLVVGVVVGLVADNVAVGVIVGAFAAILGGVVGGMAGGGGRYAGERAWEQRSAPDTAIGLVAVFCDDETQATKVARQLELLNVEEVRVVNGDGGWHLPNT